MPRFDEAVADGTFLTDGDCDNVEQVGGVDHSELQEATELTGVIWAQFLGELGSAVFSAQSGPPASAARRCGRGVPPFGNDGHPI